MILVAIQIMDVVGGSMTHMSCAVIVLIQK